MTIPAVDKPLETLREETIDQLVMNYGHGEISLAAFERRLEQALDAKEHQQLTELCADLSLKVDDAFITKKRQELGLHYTQEDAGERDLMVNIFGGSNRSGPWAPAAHIRMFNIFGGAKLDFSEAQFNYPIVRIKMFCFCGGTKLLVPEGVSVVSKAFCIFGGVDNRGLLNRSSTSPTIVIEGFMIFGGASIRLKRRMKDRLLEFGDSLRSFFSPPKT